jgi:hypothetical protein
MQQHYFLLPKMVKSNFFFCIVFIFSLNSNAFAQNKLFLNDSNIVNIGIRGNANALVDEQSLAGDPRAGQGFPVYTKFDQTYNSIYNPSTILIKLFEDHALEDLWYYDTNGKDTIRVYGGDPSSWLFLGNLVTDSYNQWRSFVIQDTFKFLRLDFRHPQASINEIVLYGEALGTNKTILPLAQALSPVSMDKLIGLNGFVDDPKDLIANAAGTLREYHRWDWDEANGQANYIGYPQNEYAFSPSWVSSWDFDAYYGALFEMGVDLAPCIQGSPAHIRGSLNNDSKPIGINENSENPASYAEHADYMFQFAARYGSSNVAPSFLKLRANQNAKSGLGFINYLEGWNEPDKWWKGREAYFTPFELAAMSSADCDGHEGLLGAGHGMKAADPDMKMIMPGLASFDLNYLEGVRIWSEYNRQSGFPFDVINFHHYSNNGGGQFTNATKAVSPEDDRLKEKLQRVVSYRDTWLPGKEIWLSEFGYDTNPSSPQSPPSLGNNDIIEVQSQWLLRSFLEIAAAGIDRAQMYMLRDVNAANPNQYNSSGLTQEKWNQHQTKKSYFYLSGMRSILKNYSFDGEVILADPELRAYRFKQKETDSICYAVWSATSRARIVSNYKFSTAGMGRAILVEVQSDSVQGRMSALPILQDSVEFIVSEMPVFLKVLPLDPTSPLALARDITVYLDSLGNAEIPVDLADAGSFDDIRIARLFSSSASLACADLPAGQNSIDLILYLYACDHYQCDSASFILTLIDSISPKVDLKKYSANLDASGQLQVQVYDFVSSMQDNCDGPITLSLSKNSFDCSDLQEGGVVTIVSDTSWRKSTYISMVNALTWPWSGAGDFPSASTYSDSVEVGQPYRWHSIDPVAGSEVIKAGSRVQYFKKSFRLSGNVLKANFSITVDDDIEIYLNGKLLARENVWGAATTGSSAVHSFEILANGAYTNGPGGKTAFGLVNGLPLAHYFTEGENEVLVVVRNGGPGNIGGFSFKMDLETSLQTLIVSDASWEKSTLVSSKGSHSFPWQGAQELPQDASFSQSALLGQPMSYKTIDSVFGAEVIKCGPDVEFYRKKFQVNGNYWSGLRLWMRVDDDMEIYLNGKLIARENVWGNPSMGAGSLHSFSLAANNAHSGSDSSQGFGLLDSLALNYLQGGENEIMLAVRNTGNGNTGGFSLRMEIDGEASQAIDLIATDIHGNSSYHQVHLRVLDSTSACQSNVFAKRLSVVEPADNTRVDLKMYPNPVQSLLWLSLPEQTSGLVEVQIINTAGQLIKSFKQDVYNKKELSVNLELLDPAVYIVRVLGSFGSYTERIMKT